jgi:transcriptional regulator with XRE-family HTH domain
MEGFSGLLERFRTRAGFSQNELARKAGVSPSYVNRLEKGGRQPPSRDVMHRIAEALGLDKAEENALLLSGGYAPEDSSLPPMDRLMADMLQDADVPEEEIELLRQQIELFKRQIELLRRRRNP